MHPGVKWVVGGWTAFFAENIILSENRTAIIDAFGEDGYMAGYSTLSTLSMGSVFLGYYKHAKWRPARLPLKYLGVGMRMLGAAAVAQSLPPLRNFNTGSGAGMKAFCPMDLQWSKNAEGKEVYGFKRITRHPQLWGCAVFGMGTAIGSVCPVTRAVALGFTPCALIMGAHIDSRYSRGIGGTMSEEVKTTTSLIPFYAVATGDQDLAQAWDEAKQTNAIAAGLLAAALF